MTLPQMTTNNATGNNTYVLFGWEAIEAQPNRDPFLGTLRIDYKTNRVFTSDVHIKHHVRRGIKAEMKAVHGLRKAQECIFYEKKDVRGNSRTLKKRLQEVRTHHDIEKKSPTDALNYCVDLPLFGYAQTVKGETLVTTNTTNTLYRPSTFHPCKIYNLTKNNAFPGEKKDGMTKKSAGSSPKESLEYGYFLALWEFNRKQIEINARNHKLLPWDEYGVDGWLSLFCNGLWRAYSSDRFTSVTQRSQFARRLHVWTPPQDIPLSYCNPAEILFSERVFSEAERREILYKEVTNSKQAHALIERSLPEFLAGWRYTDETKHIEHVIN